MALIQYGCLYQTEPVRQNRSNGMVEQTVLQAYNWTPGRPTTYKVWIDFRNRLKNREEILEATFSQP